MLFVRRCPGCGRQGWCPCASCVASLEPARPISVPGARRASALIEYEGVARDLVHALKFGRGRDLAPWFGEAMSAEVWPDSDLVTWLPTTPHRRRQRGYDQAQLLARAIGRTTRRSVRRALRRADDRGPQTELAAADRRNGPAFDASRAVGGRAITLVDDVVTTGTSLSNAIDSLLHRGAASVDVLVIARTPAPPERRSGTAPRPTAI